MKPNFNINHTRCSKAATGWKGLSRGLFLAFFLLPFTIHAQSNGSTIDLADSLTLQGTGWTYSDSVFTVTGDVTITGKTNFNRIVVASGSDVTITLDGAEIQSTVCAFDMSGAIVNLILRGNNTVRSGYLRAGVEVPKGSKLTISGTGSFTVYGGWFAAGIGGATPDDAGEITINDGTINALGGLYSAGIGGGEYGAAGKITINGGSIEAGSIRNGPGIGSGIGSSTTETDTITINGGTVVANGGLALDGFGGGAGIGSAGGYRGTIGGPIIFSGSKYPGKIIISGTATVTATGGNSDEGAGGAGIGSGGGGANSYSDRSIHVSINTTGTVKATGGTGVGAEGVKAPCNGAAIGTGGGPYYDYGGAWKVGHGKGVLPGPPKNVTCTQMNNGKIKLSWDAPEPINGIEITDYEVSGDNGVTWVKASSDKEHLLDDISGGSGQGLLYNLRVRALFDSGYGAEIFSGFPGNYIDLNNSTIPDGEGWTYDSNTHVFTVTGDVIIGNKNPLNRIRVKRDPMGGLINIILIDADIQLSADEACAFDMSGSIVDMTLYGKNILKSGSRRAGLEAPEGSMLVIGGTGSLTATGGEFGAGIGGGYGHGYSTIIIRGDTRVTATSGQFGAGIGSGHTEAGVSALSGSIHITDYATVTATSPGFGSAAGIGGSRSNSSGDITIDGNATVTAIGALYSNEPGGAGIGSGGSPDSNWAAAVGTIIINTRGTVKAEGGGVTREKKGAAIGYGASLSGPGTPVLPSAPRNFTVIPPMPESDFIKLTWEPPKPVNGITITGYEVSGDGGDSWVKASSDTEHLFDLDESTYTPESDFRVRALFDNGYSDEANISLQTDGHIDLSDNSTQFGTGWIYNSSNHTFTVMGNVTITGTTTTNRVVVASGFKGGIILHGASIQLYDEDACAFDINGATVDLLLKGNNTLKSGFGRAGLEVPEGSTLMIKGMGNLSVTGGDNNVGGGGAGIGSAGSYSGKADTPGTIGIDVEGTLVARGGTGTVSGANTCDGAAIGSGGSRSGPGTPALITAPRYFRALWIPGLLGGPYYLRWELPEARGLRITGFEVSNDGGASWTRALSNWGHNFPGTEGQVSDFRVRALFDYGYGAEAVVDEREIICLHESITRSGKGWTYSSSNSTYTVWGDVIIFGSTSSNRVDAVPQDSDVNIVLDNAVIELDISRRGSAFGVIGSTVNLILQGKNTLKGFSGSGVGVPEGSTLTIGGTGSLTAQGGGTAAGIGGLTSSGNITIGGNATVTATGAPEFIGGAGIGSGANISGYDPFAVGPITINTTGTVTVAGGGGYTDSKGAAIGFGATLAGSGKGVLPAAPGRFRVRWAGDFLRPPHPELYYLTWEPSTPINGLRITGYEVSNDGGATWTRSQTDTSHEFPGKKDQEYDFRVRTLFRGGYGAEAIVGLTQSYRIDLGDSLTPEGTGWTYNSSNHTFTVTGNVIITGTTTTNRVVVAPGSDVSIILDGAGIQLNEEGACAFDIAGATVELLLKGDNMLKSGSGRAGLEAPEGSALTIDGIGSLTATAGSGDPAGGAGIGGGGRGASGEITIISGTAIIAAGGNSTSSGGGAGIGSGGSSGSVPYKVGAISINTTGTVKATGGTGTGIGVNQCNGAAIGAGGSASGPGRPVLPDAPQPLKAVAYGNGQVMLGWTEPAPVNGIAITGYQVSVDGGASWSEPQTALNHVFELTGSPEYDFHVRAVFNYGYGVEAVTTTVITDLSGQIDLSDSSTPIGIGWTYSDHVFTVTDDVIITGTTTTNGVLVAPGSDVNITLDDADIQLDEEDACAFDMSGATVKITLLGNNTLKSGGHRAGLEVPEGSAVTVDGTGSLTAAGGIGRMEAGAGIGGGGVENSGEITITGDVTIVATGGDSYYYSGGAGIGSGGSANSVPPTADAININTTGTVEATGGKGAIDFPAIDGPGAAIGTGGGYGVPGIAVLPTAPQNFRVVPEGNGQVILSWTEPTPVNGISITGYEVSVNKGAPWVTVSSGTEYTFTGLAEDKEYNFRVRALFNYGFGVEAGRTPQIPQPTYGVSIGSFSGGSITADKAVYEENEVVTLTITTDPGYLLNSISAYKTSEPSTVITLSGTGDTRSFNMPAFGVTIVATFRNLNQAVNTAKELVEAATYTVVQSEANTEADVKIWLAAQINALAGMNATGITVLASDITTSNFTAAVAGTSDSPSGTNGSFDFTVSLTQGASSLTTAGMHGTIAATPYMPPATYTVTIGQPANGNVTISPQAPFIAGTTVTLTITPDTGYELHTISAHKTGDETTPVALAGTGDAHTFSMPGYNVTVRVIFRETQEQLDKEAVEAAKAAVEGGIYRIAQETGNTETTVRVWLVNTLNELFGQSNGIRFRPVTSIVGEITLTAITPAIAGTEDNPAGADGSFTFTVTLTRGAATSTTNGVTGVIVATPYRETPEKSIEVLPNELNVRILNTGKVETGELTLTLSGEDADAFTLPAATVSSLPVGGETDITLIPRENLAPDAYTAILTVSGEGLASVSVEIVHITTNTGIDDAQQAKPLRGWVQNGTLFVSGLTPGKPWNVYNTSGVSVYNGIADDIDGNVALTVRGVYIVVSEGKTMKVVY